MNVTYVTSSTAGAFTFYLNSSVDVAGDIYCVLYRQFFKTVPVSLDIILSTGRRGSFESIFEGIGMRFTELLPATRYKLFCAVQTVWTTLTSYEDAIAAPLEIFTTGCCKDFTFDVGPQKVYGDVTQYVGSTDNVFSFSLSAHPESNLTTTIMVSFPDGTPVPDDQVEILPSSTYVYTPDTPAVFLTRRFIISGTETFGGDTVVRIIMTGPSTEEYYEAVLARNVTILSNGTLPAPVMVDAAFANDGLTMSMAFDFPTDSAGLVDVWSCDELFEFEGASECDCVWADLKTVKAQFSTDINVNQTVPGARVTLLGGLLRGKCTNALCELNEIAGNQTLIAAGPTSPLTPTVSISSLPGSTSYCTPTTLKISGSGSGGRRWANIAWTVTSSDAFANVTRIQQVLDQVTSLDNPVTIPQDYLDVTTYTYTLNVTNYLGGSTVSAAEITISASAYVPLVTILAGVQTSVRVNDDLSILGLGSVAECAGQVPISFSWKVYTERGALLPGVISESRDTRKLLLSAYTLNVGNTYVAVLNATVSESFGTVSSTASVTIDVTDGDVVAIVLGGSTRRFPVDANFTLDGSSSYDENLGTSEGLIFKWTCTIASARNGFGEICDFMAALVSTDAQLIVPAYSMDANEVYEFAFAAEAPDGRFAGLYVIVTGAPPKSVALEIDIIADAIYSEDEKITVFASFKAPFGILATWAVSQNEEEVDASNFATDPSKLFAAGFASSGLRYPLVVRKGSLFGGLTYSFKLTACAEFNATLCASASIDIDINKAPYGGGIVVSPSEGVAFDTIFDISAYDWQDDEISLPIDYVFYSRRSESSPSLTIKLRSVDTNTKTNLAQGLENRQFVMTIGVIASDTFGAENSEVTTNVIVKPEEEEFGVELAQNFTVVKLAQSLAAFESTRNPDVVLSVASVVTSILNEVNCSAAPNCTALNRNKCLDTPNTCSSCFDGYSGVVGDANSRCSPPGENILGNIGDLCILDGDCLYSYCLDQICEAPPLGCKSAIEGETCSGHGVCMYEDPLGRPFSNCTIFDVQCSSYCSCDDGYGGDDCSLDGPALARSSDMRTTVCNSLLDVIEVSDLSSSLLTTVITQLFEAFDPAEVVTDDGVRSCLEVMIFLGEASINGFIEGTTDETRGYLFSTISDLIVTMNTTAGGNYEQEISTAVESIISGLSGELSEGEPGGSYVSNNVRVSTNSVLLTDIVESALNPPLTEAEAVYGYSPSGIQIASIDSCQFTSSYVTLSTLGYGKSPYAAPEDLISSVLALTSSGATCSPIPSNSTDPAYYVTIQFTSKQEFNLTEFESGVYGNITIPECAYYNGYEYVNCQSCNISSFTEDAAIYGCYDLSVLFATFDTSARARSARAGRSLQADDDGTGAESLVSYSSLITNIAASLPDTLSVNPFAIDLEQATVVLTMTACLVLITIIGTIGTLKWDNYDRQLIIYKCENKKTKNMKKFREEHKTDKDLEEYFADEDFDLDEPFRKSNFLRSWMEEMHSSDSSSSGSRSGEQLRRSSLYKSEYGSISESRSGENTSDSAGDDTGDRDTGSEREASRSSEDDDLSLSDFDKFFQFRTVKEDSSRDLDRRGTLGTLRSSIMQSEYSEFDLGVELLNDPESFYSSSSDKDSHSQSQRSMSDKLKKPDSMYFIPTKEYTGALVADLLSRALPRERLYAKGNWRTQMYNIFIRYHDMFRMFGDKDLGDTRTMRWLRFNTFVLSSMFICTTFYQQFYPDSNSLCNTYTTKEECLAEPSRLSSSIPLCQFYKSDSSCAPRPPPTSFVFLAVVFFIVFVLAAFTQFFLWYIFDTYASKRPRLEEIGLRTDDWIGTGNVRKNYPGEKKADDASALAKVMMMRTKAAELTNKDVLMKESSAKLLYEDLKTPEEEATTLALRVKQFFAHDVETHLTPVAKSVGGEETSIIGKLASNDAKVRAISKVLNLYNNGDPHPLSIFERLRYRNAYAKLVGKIKDRRQRAQEIVEKLQSMRDENIDEQYLETSLIQFFALEQLSALKRFAIMQHLFQFSAVAPDSVSPYTWIASWVFITSMIMFFLYWIFAWGLTNGGTTLTAWGIQFAMAIGYTVFFIQPVKVLLGVVVAVQALRPQVMTIYRTLTNVAMSVVQEENFVETDFRVVQHMSAACRASRHKIAENLCASQILRHVDDIDIERCREYRKSHLGVFAVSILLIPAIIAFYGELGQFIIEGFMVAMVSGLMMASEVMAAVDLRFLIAIYMPIVLYVIYLVYHYRRQNHILKQHGKLLDDDDAPVPVSPQDSQKMRKSRRRRNSWVRDETIRRVHDNDQSSMLYRRLIQLCKYVSDVMRGNETQRAKDKKAKNNTWMNMNRHNENQAYASQLLKDGTGFSSQLNMFFDASEVEEEDKSDLLNVDHNYLEGNLISTIPAEIRDMTHFMSSFLVLQGKFEGLDVRMSANLFGVKLPKKLTTKEVDADAARTVEVGGRMSRYALIQRTTSTLTLQRVNTRFSLARNTSSTLNVNANMTFKNLMSVHSQFNVLDEEDEHDVGTFESFVYTANRSTFTQSAAVKYREKQSISTDVDKALARVIHSTRIRGSGVTNTVTQLLQTFSSSSQHSESADSDGVPIMMNTQTLREEFNAVWDGFYPGGTELNEEERKEADEAFIAWAKTQSSDYTSGSGSGSGSGSVNKLSGRAFGMSPLSMGNSDDLNLIFSCVNEVNSRESGSPVIHGEEKDAELIDERRASTSLVRSVTTPTLTVSVPGDSDELTGERDADRDGDGDGDGQGLSNVPAMSRTFSEPLVAPALGRYHSMVRKMSGTALSRYGSEGGDSMASGDTMHTGRSRATPSPTTMMQAAVTSAQQGGSDPPTERTESNKQTSSRRSSRSEMPVEVNTVYFSRWFRAIVAEVTSLHERNAHGASASRMALSGRLSTVSNSFRFPRKSISRRKSSISHKSLMSNTSGSMEMRQRGPKLSSQKIKQIRKTNKDVIAELEADDDMDEFIAAMQAELTTSQAKQSDDVTEDVNAPFSTQEDTQVNRRGSLLSFAGDHQDRFIDLDLENDVDIIAEDFITPNIGDVGSDDDYFAESKTTHAGFDEEKGAGELDFSEYDVLGSESFDEMTGSLLLRGSGTHSASASASASAGAPTRSTNEPSASRTSSDGLTRQSTASTDSSGGYFNLNDSFTAMDLHTHTHTNTADTTNERHGNVNRTNRVNITEHVTIPTGHDDDEHVARGGMSAMDITGEIDLDADMNHYDNDDDDDDDDFVDADGYYVANERDVDMPGIDTGLANLTLSSQAESKDTDTGTDFMEVDSDNESM
jgi:hypothetical protein